MSTHKVVLMVVGAVVAVAAVVAIRRLLVKEPFMPGAAGVAGAPPAPTTGVMTKRPVVSYKDPDEALDDTIAALHALAQRPPPAVQVTIPRVPALAPPAPTSDAKSSPHTMSK